ncbi:MAG: TetR-like C-terminal domain-containing protein [Acidimicrobiales bacterium]
MVASEVEALTGALHDAAATTADPVEALLATCRAYVATGRAHPNRYRVVYERRFLEIWDERRPMPQTGPLMARNIELGVGLVQACVDAGRSASTDAYADMAAIGMFLHGLVTLPLAITSLPWPDTEQILTDSVTRLARIQPAPPTRRRSQARR